MTKIVTVTMNPAVDMIVELPSLVPYAVNKARGERIFCGGKGINVSLVLSLLGVETAACGFLGTDNATAFRAFCDGQNIEFAFDLLPGRTRTNVKLAVDGCPATDINLPGLPVGEQDIAALARRLRGMAGGEILFILSGSLPPGAPAGVYADLIGMLRSEGARVYVDASGKALALALAAGPDLAKPNHDELLELEPGGGNDLAAVVAAARRRLVPGRALSVSMGAEGALWLSERECLRIPRAEVAARNLVGAGDTFLAGLAYGELAGWDAARQLAFANALAGHWVEKMERTVLDRDRVDALAAAMRPQPCK